MAIAPRDRRSVRHARGPLNPRFVPRPLAGVALAFVLAATLPWQRAESAPAPVSQEARPTVRAPARPEPADAGVTWQELTPPQKDFLQPLEREWQALDPGQKRKWMVLTARVPKMSLDERTRIQARMTDWAKLTPEQRGQARMRYQEAKQLPLHERQARWDAYQSLSSEQKRALAERASLAASAPPPARRGGAPGGPKDRADREAPQAKSNIVPNPGLAASPRQLSSTLVQARPGATTTLITRTPAPPPHQQSGMPKIAATPEYVNKSTLLPRHGPQSAAMRAAAAASASEGPPRQ